MRATRDVTRTEVVRPVEENEHYGGEAGGEAETPDEPGPKPGGARPETTRPRRRIRWLRVLLTAGILTSGALGALALYEARTSYLQARVFSDAARTQYWDLHAGSSDRLVPPGEGPYDLRLGYTRLPDFTGFSTVRTTTSRSSAPGFASPDGAAPSASGFRSLAARIMPWLTSPRSWRGSRFATITTCFPTSDAGSYQALMPAHT